MRRIGLLAQRNSPLRLRFAEGELTVSARTQDVGEASESLPAAVCRRRARDRLQRRVPARRARVDRLLDRSRQADQPAPPRRAAGRDARLHVPDHADPPGGLSSSTASHVDAVTLRSFRSYASLELALSPGRRPRDGRERRRQDEPPRGDPSRDAGLLAAHAHRRPHDPHRRARRVGRAARWLRAGVRHRVRVKLAAGAGKTAELDGTPACLGGVASARVPDARVHARPARRRQGRARRCAAHISTARSRACLPARGGLPQDYAAALAQRNAALRRVQLGLSPRDAVTPWTERVARARSAARGGAARDGGRARAGLQGARSRPSGFRAGRSRTRAIRRDRGSRGASRRRPGPRTTGLGPHLDDLPIAAGRELRGFGSQGEQRLAVLALLLAEAALSRRRRSCCSTTSSRSSTCAAASARGRGRRARPDGDHGHACLGAARSARPVVEVSMERLSDTVRGELRPLRPAGGLGEILAALAGRGRRGDRAECLARADRPRRHAARQHGRLRVGLRARPARSPRSPSGSASRRVRFAPGPLAGELREARSRPPCRPAGGACARRPRSLPPIADENLRKTVEKAAALSLASSAGSPPALIHCVQPAKLVFCRHFLFQTLP